MNATSKMKMKHLYKDVATKSKMMSFTQAHPQPKFLKRKLTSTDRIEKTSNRILHLKRYFSYKCLASKSWQKFCWTSMWKLRAWMMMSKLAESLKINMASLIKVHLGIECFQQKYQKLFKLKKCKNQSLINQEIKRFKFNIRSMSRFHPLKKINGLRANAQTWWLMSTKEIMTKWGTKNLMIILTRRLRQRRPSLVPK
jgi:hypothetical protein